MHIDWLSLRLKHHDGLVPLQTHLTRNRHLISDVTVRYHRGQPQTRPRYTWSEGTIGAARSNLDVFTDSAVIDGNPAKYHATQNRLAKGQGLFGSDQPLNLAEARTRLLTDIHCDELPILELTSSTDWEITRLDLAQNLLLDSPEHVQNWLALLSSHVISGNTPAYHRKTRTRTWNPNSRQAAVRAYPKQLEMKRATAARQAAYTDEQVHLARHLVRWEVMLKRETCKNAQLEHAEPSDLELLYATRGHQHVQLTSHLADYDEAERLLRAAYPPETATQALLHWSYLYLWGEEVTRRRYAKATFAKWRKKLEAAGLKVRGMPPHLDSRAPGLVDRMPVEVNSWEQLREHMPAD